MIRTAVADAEAAATHAADVVARHSKAALAARGEAHVCLAGGSTPLRAYELLGPLVDDWSAVHLWYGDERCVAFDHPDSNHGAARARLDAPGALWHPMPGELGPVDGAASYSRELGSTVLDVTLLGMGPDGHTASLFPGHALLEASGVAAGIADSPKPPPHRITLTLPTLGASRHIVLLVAGADKADALARASGEPDAQTPVSLLPRDALEVVADDAARSRLPDRW